MKVHIMRGLPGSGKSTYCQKVFPNVDVCSADSFFMNDGKYTFSSEKLPEAHRSCMRKFLMQVVSNQQDIVVDNTFIRVYEIAPYFTVADALGYEVEIYNFVISVEQSFKRNVHNVPLETIQRMYDDSIREYFPAWYKVRCSFRKG